MSETEEISRLLAMLDKPDSPVDDTIVATIEEIGWPAIKALLDLFTGNDTNKLLRVAAALNNIKTIPAPAILEVALKDKRWQVRCSAIYALANRRDPGVIDLLILALKDKSAAVRRNASWMLLNHGEEDDSRLVEPFISLLTDKSKWVRFNAANGLNRFGDQRAVIPLTQVLGDSYTNTRRVAIMALGELGDERVVEPLIEALADSDAQVCFGAVGVLGKLKDSRAVEPLLNMLPLYSYGEIYGAVINALGAIGDPQALPELERIAREDNRLVSWGETGSEKAQKAIRQIKAATVVNLSEAGVE